MNDNVAVHLACAERDRRIVAAVLVVGIGAAAPRSWIALEDVVGIPVGRYWKTLSVSI